jgi:hypothetical protein
MGVQAIQNDIDPLSIGIKDIHQVTHGISEFEFGAPTSNQDRSKPGLWLNQHEQIASAIAFVLIILSGDPARLHTNGLTHFSMEFLAFLIKAN